MLKALISLENTCSRIYRSFKEEFKPVLSQLFQRITESESEEIILFPLPKIEKLYSILSISLSREK
jgi:hypothetical protein